MFSRGNHRQMLEGDDDAARLQEIEFLRGGPANPADQVGPVVGLLWAHRRSGPRPPRNPGR